MSKERIYLNSGAKKFTLPSGDEGLYIDICIEDLERVIDENEKEDILRPWISRKENRTYNNIRIFAIPKPDGYESFHTHYLEVAKPKKN